ncbi:hypothetical protein DXG03_005798, partial [Asterophora parasitica]
TAEEPASNSRSAVLNPGGLESGRKVCKVALSTFSCFQGFPPAWMTSNADTYVIDFAHWNKEPAPEFNPPQVTYSCFSADWRWFGDTDLLMRSEYGVEIWGLIIRLYFGFKGCIIPVAYMPDSPAFVFTIAGPYDADEKKDFYIFNYDYPLSGEQHGVHRAAA